MSARYARTNLVLADWRALAELLLRERCRLRAAAARARRSAGGRPARLGRLTFAVDDAAKALERSCGLEAHCQARARTEIAGAGALEVVDVLDREGNVIEPSGWR